MSDITSTPERQPRADAQRNRAHILDVAEQHFGEHSITGSLDAIAKRAGVGSGTLYRHFPNRDALLAALLQAREEGLAARREAIQRDAASATDALAQWLDALGEWATAFDGLPDPLRQALTTDDKSPLAYTCETYIELTDEFLRVAQREGGANPDVRGRDLFLGVLAIGWVAGAAMADESSHPRLSAMMRAGWERT